MKNIAENSLGALRREANPNHTGDLLVRHCVTVHERDVTAAYYFSAPIRTEVGAKLLEMQWNSMPDGVFVHHGTGCSVYVREDSILFRTQSDTVRVRLPGNQGWRSTGMELIGEDTKLTCTLNGIVIHKCEKAGKRFAVTVTPAYLGYGRRANSKCFAIMKHTYQPIFTASALCHTAQDNTVSPLVMETAFDARIKKYRLAFFSTGECDGVMQLELNMYEPKVIQDTTVESAHPDENNAFGSVAFVGNSELFGEQKLYIKFDYPRFSEMKNKHLVSIRLWLPILCGSRPLEAYAMHNRFCSFGSTWNKQIKHGGRKLPLTQRQDFCCVDLSDRMIDKQGRLLFSNGLLLQAVPGFEGYCALATGDNYSTPVILECRYLS